MSNVVSMKKTDYDKALHNALHEVAGRSVDLVRNAGSRLTAMMAALTLLGTVAAKADVPSVRIAADTSHGVIEAQRTPIANAESATLTVARRPPRAPGFSPDNGPKMV